MVLLCLKPEKVELSTSKSNSKIDAFDFKMPSVLGYGHTAEEEVGRFH